MVTATVEAHHWTREEYERDICRAIGYEPDRVALYRLLEELVRDGKLRIQDRGEGRKATRYRRA